MGLLPWQGDAMSRVMDIFFGPRVSTWTLVDDDSWGVDVFKGKDRRKVPCTRACKILGGESVIDLSCVRS